MRLEAIASELEAIAIRLGAIAIWLEAIASMLDATATNSEAIAIGLEAIVIRLDAIASRLEAITTRLARLRPQAIALRLKIPCVFIIVLYISALHPLSVLFLDLPANAKASQWEAIGPFYFAWHGIMSGMCADLRSLKTTSRVVPLKRAMAMSHLSKQAFSSNGEHRSFQNIHRGILLPLRKRILDANVSFQVVNRSFLTFYSFLRLKSGRERRREKKHILLSYTNKSQRHLHKHVPTFKRRRTRSS